MITRKNTAFNGSGYNHSMEKALQFILDIRQNIIWVTGNTKKKNWVFKELLSYD